MMPGKDTLKCIEHLIRYIGDDPERLGLIDTPMRVINSFEELYSGYAEIVDMTSFEEPGHDQIILLRDIEFYSTCEHHMLPFFGKAHVAYIPNKNKIVGISKLARLVEVFSRRLQIQERIGRQVVKALEKHLNPLGSACIIEAKHFCMISRGVNKQNSTMVTSSISGAFKENVSTKNELMRLINGK